MSAPDGHAGRAPQRYGTIVIVGGGCYGRYYHRQLQRAARAGAVVAERLLIVDRDASCVVATALSTGEDASPIPCEMRIVEWRDFFDTYLSGAAHAPEQYANDAIVPSPLMPHLMGEWLVERARSRPGGIVATRPFEHPPAVPWDRAGDDGTHYVSFATWMCPINCIEPRTCPHTKGERTWSMPQRLAEYASERAAVGDPIEVAVLHCEHRAYGVGMFDTLAVIRADEQIRAAAEGGISNVVIGTVSHCHGALTRLVLAEQRLDTDAPIDSHIR